MRAQQDRMFRQIVETSADGLWLVDDHGRTLFVNARVAELLGLTSAELATRRVNDVFASPWWATDAGAVDVQRLCARPDGTEIPLLVSERPVLDEYGHATGRLYQITDDQRRWSLLNEFRHSQSQLAEAQSIARLGSWELRTQPRAVSWSQGMYDVLGVDPGTFVPGPDTFADRIVEPDRQRADENWRLVSRGEGQREIDIRVRRGDGEVRWVRAVGEVLERDRDGAPLRYGGTVQDVHELKETELDLLDALEVNTLMQFLATAANQAATYDAALVSLRELLLQHQDWQRAVAFDVAHGALRFRPVGVGDVEPTTFERALAVRALTAGIEVFEEDWQPEAPMIAFPVRLDDDVISVLVVTARSPFERHRMLQSLVTQVAGQLGQVAVRDRAAAELAETRDLALAASEAKSEFLAMMSHEIRTPLNGVIGLNDLLLHTDLDPRQRELAEAMQGAGRALLVLISDILDFSKIEAGRLELEAVEFQPAVVVEGIRDLFAADALSRGIALEVCVAPGVPQHLEGDPSRFGQILANLVSNAVKFTHEGRVRMHVAAHPGVGDVVLRVEVADTGIGMDAEQRTRIFQPFRQADRSTNRTFGGTGLGLAIAHQLAEALGGRIGVESTPGVGSTFWFDSRFRLAAEQSRPVRVDPPRTRAGGHVLVVEDNEVNQLVAVGMLQVLGYTSEVAGDGAAAAARVASGRYDAVLMDLQMPRLDGFAATRLIRHNEAGGSRVPIVALTASATAGEEQRCREAGMTGFLTKPVRLDDLGRVLAEQLGAPTRAELAAAAPVTAARVLDPSRLAELAEMGAEALPLIRRAVENFVQAAETTVPELDRHWRAGDAVALRAAVHRLKGSAANLGAERVAAVALAVELQAEDGDLEAAGTSLVHLAGELDDAVAALAAYRFPEEGRADQRTA